MAKHGLSPREPRRTTTWRGLPGSDGVPTAPEPSVSPALRWEERLITVLAARLDAPEGTASFELASVLETLIGKVTSFGARIEDLTPSGLVAVFGIHAMEDGPRRAVHAARAMIRALGARDDPALRVDRSLRCPSRSIPDGDRWRRHRPRCPCAARGIDDVDRPPRAGGAEQVVVDVAAARLVERHFGLEATGDVPHGPYRVVVDANGRDSTSEGGP